MHQIVRFVAIGRSNLDQQPRFRTVPSLDYDIHSNEKVGIVGNSRMTTDCINDVFWPANDCSKPSSRWSLLPESGCTWP